MGKGPTGTNFQVYSNEGGLCTASDKDPLRKGDEVNPGQIN